MSSGIRRLLKPTSLEVSTSYPSLRRCRTAGSGEFSSANRLAISSSRDPPLLVASPPLPPHVLCNLRRVLRGILPSRRESLLSQRGVGLQELRVCHTQFTESRE